MLFRIFIQSVQVLFQVRLWPARVSGFPPDYLVFRSSSRGSSSGGFLDARSWDYEYLLLELQFLSRVQMFSWH